LAWLGRCHITGAWLGLAWRGRCHITGAYSTLLYIIFTVSMVLQSRQNMKKINVFRPVSEQNFIPEYIFIFILSSTQIF
jgi:hypothetical protein